MLRAFPLRARADRRSRSLPTIGFRRTGLAAGTTEDLLITTTVLLHGRHGPGPACCVLVVLAALFLSVPAMASDDEAGMWVTTTARRTLDPDWRAALAIQSRLIDGVDTLERLILRPSITRVVTPRLSWTLGYDTHFIETPRDHIEHRTWQQGLVSRKVDTLLLAFRTRLEQRYIEDVSGVALRGRFMVSGKWPSGLAVLPLFVLRDEVIVHMNTLAGGPRSGYDQNRFFAGLAGPISERLRAEIGYQMQHIGRPGEDVTYHQAIISFTANLD